MISIISKKIVQYLIAASAIETETDQAEVYIYGLECFLNTGITILILCIWGFLTNTLMETFCWIAAFSILRHHSGGLHAPTQFTCILSSCLLGFSNFFILNTVSYHIVYLFITWLFCFTVCILYAPTDSSKYEITESIRKKEKLYSILILCVGVFVAFMFRNSISISILYSDICVCILILFRVVFRKATF